MAATEVTHWGAFESPDMPFFASLGLEIQKYWCAEVKCLLTSLCHNSVRGSSRSPDSLWQDHASPETQC